MIRYYVNEEKRTVVAAVEDTQFDAVDAIIKRCPYFEAEDAIKFSEDGEAYLGLGLEKALMEDKYSAKAKCHPEDKFDVEKGKEIAAERLNAKLNCARKRAIARWRQRFMKVLASV